MDSSSKPKAQRNNQLIIAGIAVAVLCVCFIWLAVLGRLDQDSNAPANIPQATNTLTKTEAYRLKVSENMVLLANAFAILDPLLQNPQLDNEDWILAITVSIESVRKSHEEIIRAEPPPEMLNLHSFIMDATGDCKESMDFLTDAIHRRNQESTVRAKDLLLSCNQKLTKANQEVQEFH